MKISLQAKEPQDLLYFIITVPDHCHPSIRNFSTGKLLVCRSSGVSQDPRPFRAHPDQNHPEILEGVPQGAKGLLSGCGSGCAKNGRGIELYLTSGKRLNRIKIDNP